MGCRAEMQAVYLVIPIRCNLAFHPKKTKVMPLLSTPQMSQTHGLDGHCIHLCANGKSLKRVLTFRLLGAEVQENVNWKRERNSKISSGYGTLSVLKKLKYLAPYNEKKKKTLGRVSYFVKDGL